MRGDCLRFECFVRPADRHFGSDCTQNVVLAGDFEQLAAGLILYKKRVTVTGKAARRRRRCVLEGFGRGHRSALHRRGCVQSGTGDAVGEQWKHTAQHEKYAAQKQKGSFHKSVFLPKKGTVFFQYTGTKPQNRAEQAVCAGKTMKKEALFCAEC